MTVYPYHASHADPVAESKLRKRSIYWRASIVVIVGWLLVLISFNRYMQPRIEDDELRFEFSTEQVSGNTTETFISIQQHSVSGSAAGALVLIGLLIAGTLLLVNGLISAPRIIRQRRRARSG